MKKNNFDFKKPTKQSPVAILIILQRVVRSSIRQLLIPIAAVIFGAGFDRSFILVLGIILLLAIMATWAIMDYLRYHFYLDDDELVVNRGVLSKKKTNLKFSRIQSVDFEQNLLQRLLNVVRVKIDTAGSTGSEFEMDAIDLAQATQLRNILLEKAQANKGTNTQEEAQAIIDPPKEKILNLSIGDLIISGLTANHFKTIGAFLGLLLYIFGQNQDYVEDQTEQAGIWLKNIIESSSFLLIIGAILSSFVLLIIGTIIYRILYQYDLTLFKLSDRFKYKAGLLKVAEKSAKFDKIQVVDWNDNLFRRLFKMFSVNIRQAVSGNVKRKDILNIIGARMPDIQGILKTLFPHLDLETLKFNGINPFYLFRRIYLSAFIPAALITLGLLLAGEYIYILIPAAFFIIQSILSVMNFRKKKFAISDDVLCMKGGSVGDDQQIMATYKAQTVDIRQSPFLRRRGLATVVVHTAAGKQVTIPCISLNEAHQLADFIIATTEQSKKSWM